MFVFFVLYFYFNTMTVDFGLEIVKRRESRRIFGNCYREKRVKIYMFFHVVVTNSCCTCGICYVALTSV